MKIRVSFHPVLSLPRFSSTCHCEWTLLALSFYPYIYVLSQVPKTERLRSWIWESDRLWIKFYHFLHIDFWTLPLCLVQMYVPALGLPLSSAFWKVLGLCLCLLPIPLDYESMHGGENFISESLINGIVTRTSVEFTVVATCHQLSLLCLSWIISIPWQKVEKN